MCTAKNKPAGGELNALQKSKTCTCCAGIMSGWRVLSCSSWRRRSRSPWNRSTSCSRAGDRTTTVSHICSLHTPWSNLSSLTQSTLHLYIYSLTPPDVCKYVSTPSECTFIILDKQRWADASVDEEQCMVGDVNIFLTDPTEPSLAELEIMIAGHRRCFHGNFTPLLEL